MGAMEKEDGGWSSQKYKEQQEYQEHKENEAVTEQSKDSREFPEKGVFVR